jgi:hypothetical protein
MTASSDVEPLSAELHAGFDYTRSLGGALGAFMTGLRDRRILGVRGSDGRVLVPVAEYDPVDGAPLSELVELSGGGTVTSWSWMAEPLAGQPLDEPFAWALITLDGADTAMLHAVGCTEETIHSGLRVRPRWAEQTTGDIRDIVCFEAETTENAQAAASETGEPITMITSPIHLSYQHTASAEETRYLKALADGRIVGQRCPKCEKVYVPPRGACPTDGIPTRDEVELPDTGVVTTFCVVNVPFVGQRIEPPYVSAYILLDGADIAFQHLVLECDAADVHMGMRVSAKWRPRDEWSTTLENIEYFRPTGEPDAPYEYYANHL